MRSAGVLIDCAPLQPPAASTTLRVRNGDVLLTDGPPTGSHGPIGDDELALIFACCHPALDPQVRVPLTLRSVCGLSTAEIAARSW